MLMQFLQQHGRYLRTKSLKDIEYVYSIYITIMMLLCDAAHDDGVLR